MEWSLANGSAGVESMESKFVGVPTADNYPQPKISWGYILYFIYYRSDLILTGELIDAHALN